MYMSEPVWGSRIHSDSELFGHIGSGFGITVPDLIRIRPFLQENLYNF
jgi:hypothetical protein